MARANRLRSRAWGSASGRASCRAVLLGALAGMALLGGAASPAAARFVPGGNALPHDRATLAALAAPTITGFSPTSGAVGTSVTITGTDLTGATQVAFNGTAASFTVVSATQVNAVVPVGATSGPITVTTPSGTASSGSGALSFVGVGVASVTSGTRSLRLTLPAGYQAGDLLVAWLAFADNAQSITGMTGWTELPWSPLDDGTVWHARCFYKIAAASETAPTVSWTNNSKVVFQTGAWRGVSASSPIVASGGALDRVSGKNVVGPAVSNPLAGAWAIGFFSYRTSTSADKTTTFSGFTPAGLTKRADSNLAGAAYASWVDSAATDSAGAVSTGSHQFTGTTTASGSSSHKAAALLYVAPGGGPGTFTVTAAAPTVSGFSPTSGPAGTSVAITGSNLSGATAVRFNGTSASYTVSSSTQVTATVPAGATSGPVSVTTPGGTATSTASFTVTAAAPTVSGFSPTSGPVGTSVAITGSNLSGATAVRFNGTSASYTVSSSTQVTATVPAGATSGPVSVTTPGGTATSTASFTVNATAPGISGFSPTSGPVGTSVAITGSNLSGATAVRFNGTAASYTVSSSTQVTATVPAGATSGPVSVTTPGGTATSTASFTVNATAPGISGFSPTSGPVGTSVAITGSNLSGATAVRFNGTAASYTVNSSTQVTATVPAGATSGPLSVTTPGGMATSASSFTVTAAAPTVSGFSPTSGPMGTSVAITGSGLTGATAVTFNGVAASYTVNSSTQVTALVPPGATSGPISVTTPGGTATSTGSFTVTTATSSYAVYVGYYDTHHTYAPQPKPSPWSGSPNVLFVGVPDSSGSTWTGDTSAVRVDNLTASSLTNVVVTVDVGSKHLALWGTNSIPAGQSLILAQTAFENFDGSDYNPAGCYGCDPSLCITKVQQTIPVVHVTINGVTTSFSDTGQVINTHGVDSAGCPDTGSTSLRRDESESWVRLG